MREYNEGDHDGTSPNNTRNVPIAKNGPSGTGFINSAWSSEVEGNGQSGPSSAPKLRTAAFTNARGRASKSTRQ